MILIADSGSTKTDWRILDQNEVIAQTQTIGFNPYYQDADSIANELKTNLLPLCTKEVTQVFYYGTGVTNEEKAGVIKEAILKVFPTCQQIEAQSDVVGAARAACGKTAGIACILGTGSNSIYFDGEKTGFQVPPLGFWLGDEGSGANLGKRLILAYLHHELPSDLRDAFIKRFGALSRLDIFEHAYQKDFPNRWFATFSKFLFDHRKHPFCYEIVEKAFQDFCQLYLVKYEAARTVPIHFTGSVAFYYSDILKRVISSFGLRVGIISEAPMAGLTLFHKKMI